MYVQTAIILFNKRIGDDRREVFLPTCISGASYFEARGSSSSKGVHTESLSYKLRIPVNATVQDGRTYVSEAAYKGLTAEEAAAHWTIQKGDVLLACGAELTEAVNEVQLKELAAANNVDMITVSEYADNTVRGSDPVRHWRIGGV